MAVVNLLKGPTLGFDLFSDTASHKNMHKYKVSRWLMVSELCQVNVLMVFVHHLLLAENEWAFVTFLL